MTGLVRRGVPGKLAKDGWWLGDVAQSGADTPVQSGSISPAEVVSPVGVAITVCLIILADVLFWTHPVGLSLILFSAAIIVAAGICLRITLTRSEVAFITAIWVLSILPVFEYVQLSSLLFLVAGQCVVLAFLATRARKASLLHHAAQLLPAMIGFTARRIALMAMSPRRLTSTSLQRDTFLAWLLPFAAGLAFVLLFVGANPIFEQWLANAARFEPEAETFLRLGFWVCVAVAILPIALFGAFKATLRARPTKALRLPSMEGGLVNARSVTNSLFVFNMLFALQNATDLAVLWGGASLPEGVTYAEYAHSGAYPLMATSILAGVFAVMSQRFVAGSPVLRALLLLWVFQNVVLAASALGRLDLYMYAYGLTYLRLRAAIGMALIICGMLLLGWQIWHGRSSSWTLIRFASLVVATLYIGSFVNFGHIIASNNLAREGRQIDNSYICEIGALGARAIPASGQVICKRWTKRIAPQGWRDWSWRKARLAPFADLPAHPTMLPRDLPLPRS